MSIVSRASGDGGVTASGCLLTSASPVTSRSFRRTTPRIPLDAWEFDVTTELGESYRWSWAELMALPAESITTDVHCVTRWSKLDTPWRAIARHVAR